LRLQDLPASWRERLKGKGEKVSAAPVASASRGDSAAAAKSKSWRELEELILAKALLHFELDVRRAAAALDIAPSKLYQRLRESRVAERRSLWEAEPYHYKGESLSELKRRAFHEALTEAGGSAYRAARRLGVSPATVYQWSR
ncbi:MAG TPA: transposase, partial [bacterium]|nr:transposase [bacterium]